MPQINIRWADNTASLVKNLREGLDVIDATKASAEKMVRSLSGENLLRSAANYAAAINQIGGAQKLTASNQERVNAVMKRAVEQLEAAGRGSSDLANHYRDLAKQTEQVSKTGTGLTKWVGDFTSNVAQLAAGWLTAKAIISGVQGTLSAAENEISHLVMTGSAISDVSSNFETLAAKAGLVGSALIGSLREGTHRTINDFELMKTATQDLAAGMNLTDKQFGVLAKGAFALAQATGTDVKTALDTMNDAMLTGRTRALALLTGKIDLQAAEEKYAKSIGTTADHLSEEGKLEAARAGILDAVAASTERLGDQVDGLDENVAQIQATWENFNNALAKSVAESPVLAAAFQAVEEAITGAIGSNQEDLVHNLTEAINQAALKIPDFIDFIVQLGVEAARVFDDIERRAGGVGAAIKHIGVGAAAGAGMGAFAGGVGAVPGAAIGAAVGAFMPVGTTDTGPTAAMQAVEAAAKKTAEMTALMRQRMAEATDTSRQFVGPLQDVAQAQTAVGAASRNTSDFIAQGGKAAKQAADEYKNWLAAVNDALLSAKGFGAVLDTIDGAVVEAIRYYKDQGVSLERLAQMYGLTKIQAEALGQQFTFEQSVITSTTKAFGGYSAQLQVALPLVTGLTEEMTRLSSGFEDEARAAAIDTIELEKQARTRKALMDAVANQNIPLPGGKSGPQFTVPSPFDGMGGKFKDAIAGFPNLMVQALTGGGGVKGAFEGFGSQMGSIFTKGIGSSVSQMLGGVMGNILGGVIGPLGSLVGPLLDKLFSIGGPSKKELEGRQVVADFEKGFANTADMINKVGAAYVANGKTAADAQAAIQRLWAAEKQGADATKRALQDINAELQHHQEVVDAIHGEGFQSQDEIRHQADIANQAYEEMLASAGQYTQAQIDQAYHHYQELLAQLDGAAGEAARAWLKIHDAAGSAADASTDAMKSAEADLKGLIDKRNALAQGIAAEAPEEVMGVIEQQQRGQLAALDKEIKDKADAYAKLADETGQKMADAIVEALKNIHIDPVHVPVLADYPNTGINGGGRPGSGGDGSGGEDAPPVSRGGQITTTGVRYFSRGYIPMPNFRPIGTDIIPAMLTPGEMVMTAEQQRVIGRLLAQAPAAAVGGGSSRSDTVVQFGDIVIHANGATLDSIEAFAPQFNEGVRRNVGGMLTVIETVAKRATGAA